MVDGAGAWYILARVVVPLSKPVLATIALFTIVTQWNDFFQGLVLSTGEKFYPLQTYIKQLNFPGGHLHHDRGADQAGIHDVQYHHERSKNLHFHGTGIVYLSVFTKYFVSGITLGGVKE